MVCKYKFDVAIMLNMIIYFLELDEANAQLRETRKGMILFVFSVTGESCCSKILLVLIYSSALI